MFRILACHKILEALSRCPIVACRIVTELCQAQLCVYVLYPGRYL